jgi:MOSC domain-containing protein YiiM
MRLVEEASGPTDGWLEGDHGGSTKRGITFLDEALWQEVNEELGTDLAWHTRRANVLVRGVDLAALQGRRIRVGELEVEIGGETLPCGQMREAHPGLERALELHARGGMYGRILDGGAIRIGDLIEVLPDNR